MTEYHTYFRQNSTNVGESPSSRPAPKVVSATTEIFTYTVTAVPTSVQIAPTNAHASRSYQATLITTIVFSVIIVAFLAIATKRHCHRRARLTRHISPSSTEAAHLSFNRNEDLGGGGNFCTVMKGIGARRGVGDHDISESTAVDDNDYYGKIESYTTANGVPSSS